MSKWTFRWMFNKWRKLMMSYYYQIKDIADVNNYRLADYENAQAIIPLTYMVTATSNNIQRGFQDPLGGGKCIEVLNFTIQDGIFKDLNFYDVVKSSNQVIAIRIARCNNGSVSEYGDYLIGWNSNNKLFFRSNRSVDDFTLDTNTVVLIYFTPVANID